MEQRRRSLRWPEQPQRLELDLPVEAHDPDLRRGRMNRPGFVGGSNS
jgi:hypothetical protein